MPLVILVEGLIAAGKSTFIYKCLIPFLETKGLRVKVIKEPVDKWVECGILQRFYSDTTRWGYTFQAKAFHDRIMEAIRVYEEEPKADVYIAERSPYSDHIFMDVAHKDGKVDDLEYKMYREWWELWHRLLPYAPDLVVYLQTTPEVCMERLHARNRDGESKIPVEYQLKLLQGHEEVFGGANVELGPYDVPCMHLNGDSNFEKDEADRDQLLSEVWGYIEQYYPDDPTTDVEYDTE